MTIRRPLHAPALGHILVTAARRYRAHAAGRRDAALPARDNVSDVTLSEFYPRWFRFVVDNDGG